MIRFCWRTASRAIAATISISLIGLRICSSSSRQRSTRRDVNSGQSCATTMMLSRLPRSPSNTYALENRRGPKLIVYSQFLMWKLDDSLFSQCFNGSLPLSGRLPTSSAISTLVMDALPLKIAVFIVGLLWACHLLYSLDLGVYMECSGSR